MTQENSNSKGKQRIAMIPLSKIRENPVALRAVNRQSEGYLGLVDSVRKVGILNAIGVREIKDPAQPGEELYGLIDGLHRFSAAKDAGLKEIPATIQPLEEAQILEAQVIANVHKIETRPVEYSKQLYRIIIANPLMTTAELAGRLSRSPAWLGERLGLVKLTKEIAVLVDEGKINLSNAYALAKLPTEEQANFVERAMTMNPNEFVPTAAARQKEVKDLKRQGRDSRPEEFVAVAHLRKIGELKDELNTGVQAKTVLAEMNAKTPEEGFAAGVAWSLHMDKKSIEEARAKDEARRRELAADKLKRDEERHRNKQQEAVAKQVELGQESERRLHQPLAEVVGK